MIQSNSGIFESREPNTLEGGSHAQNLNTQQHYQPTIPKSPEQVELERLKEYGARDFINSIPLPSDDLIGQLAYGSSRPKIDYKKEEFPSLLTQKGGMLQGEYADQVLKTATIAGQLGNRTSERAGDFTNFRRIFEIAKDSWRNNIVNEFGDQINLFRARAEALLGATLSAQQESTDNPANPNPEELAAVIDITIAYLQAQQDETSKGQLALCEELKASIDSEVSEITASNERNRSYVVRSAIMRGVQSQLRKHGNRDLFESNGKDYYGIQRLLGIFRDAVEPENYRIQRKMQAQYGARR